MAAVSDRGDPLTPENVLFQQLFDSLSDDERRAVEPSFTHAPQWDHNQPDVAQRFASRFNRLQWNNFPETYCRLQSRFGAWLEQRGDARGEVIRLHSELAHLGECPAPPPTAELGMEDAFRADIVARPADPVPFHAFADWLEERGDERAGRMRRFGRLRELSSLGPADWVAPFGVPWRMWRTDNYERFTSRSRLVIQRANLEAQRLNHEYLGTEHLLLGACHSNLFPDGPNLALAAVRRAVEHLSPPAPDMVCMSRHPRTPRMRGALWFAQQEARSLHDATVEPNLLLLGLCRAAPCGATRALRSLGIAPALLCECALLGLGHDPKPWLRRHPEVW